MGSSDTPRFYNYPQPRAGPDVPYENETQSIPVFRGIALEIGASM
jgi:amidase